MRVVVRHPPQLKNRIGLKPPVRLFDFEPLLIAVGGRPHHLAGAPAAGAMTGRTVGETDGLAVEIDGVCHHGPRVGIGPALERPGGGIEADNHQRLVAVVATVGQGIIHPQAQGQETAARLPATGDFFLKATRTPGVVPVPVKVSDQKGQRPQAVVRPGPDVDGIFRRQNPQIAAIGRRR